MSYRVKIESGCATVDLYERQRQRLGEAATILEDLAPFSVLDTDLITPQAIAEIRRLAAGEPMVNKDTDE